MRWRKILIACIVLFVNLRKKSTEYLSALKSNRCSHTIRQNPDFMISIYVMRDCMSLEKRLCWNNIPNSRRYLKMKRVLITLASVLCFSVLMSQIVIAADTDKELQKFQGTWILVSGEHDGKQISNEHLGKGKITYDGKKATMIVPNQSDEVIEFDIIALNTSENLKRMELIRKNGPHAGKKSVGIYEFISDDQYKFALDPSGSLVLNEFTTKPGSGHVFNVWRRVQ
jgi:uncharacterized protein (TIGR03067 family)